MAWMRSSPPFALNLGDPPQRLAQTNRSANKSADHSRAPGARPIDARLHRIQGDLEDLATFKRNMLTTDWTDMGSGSFLSLVYIP